jgi:hypothetical protein
VIFELIWDFLPPPQILVSFTADINLMPGLDVLGGGGGGGGGDTPRIYSTPKKFPEQN